MTIEDQMEGAAAIALLGMLAVISLPVLAVMLPFWLIGRLALALCPALRVAV